MNWKIIAVILVVFFGGFALFQLCTDKEPSWDEHLAQQENERKSGEQQKLAAERAERRGAAQAAARAAIRERPAERLVKLETGEFAAEITTRGASLASFLLKNGQYREAPYDWSTGRRAEGLEEPLPQLNLVTTNTAEFPLFNSLRFEAYEGLDALLPDADYAYVEEESAEGKVAVFRLDQPGLPVIVTKKFELAKNDRPYELWLTVEVRNRSATETVEFRGGITQTGYQHPSEAEGGIFSKQPNFQMGICSDDAGVSRYKFSDDLPYEGSTVAAFAGVETNYFIAAMIPADARLRPTCQIYRNSAYAPAPGAVLPVVTAELRFGETQLKPGEKAHFQVRNYIGPKRYQLLEREGHGLEKAVDFGIFAPICHVLLKLLFLFQSVFSNWGVAIILLTVVVKLLLTPLQHKSFKSGERMRALKPEIDKLNEKFKDNNTEKQKATMALYKQHGVNPLSGCLPMLLQLPIWIALYSTLRTSPELYRAEFFGWIRDLSERDPYFITPIVMGALMFLQQRITPMGGDNLQMKMMMYVMPILFTAMMLFLPSGLTLYILVNTVLSLAHQWIVRRQSAARAAT